ncbi:MAG: AI-2E family transporter [Desulfobulbus sp.]|nr:AI-2E family transporter [Desulfobulbus sp.]
MDHKTSFFRALPQPWQSIVAHIAPLAVWSLFLSLVYLLRSFFLLIFLTFVFSYIQARSVDRLASWMVNRSLRVIVVALLLLSTLTATGIFFVPKVKQQTELFANQFTTYLNRVDQELYRLEQRYPLLGDILPEIQNKETQENSESPERKRLKYSPSASLLQQFLGLGEAANGLQNINQALDTLGNIGTRIASVTSAFVLSLLFSFLIVLDLANLGASVRSLQHTKVRFIYQSVAKNICEFCEVLGKALEAQLIIATINSLLTAIGISLLGLGQHLAFLTVIVFFCSFFPVIGVFISSIPICLVALQTSGLQTMLLAVVLITVIHLIEGYILNPRVYGSYMRINSVIILIILTIAGKLFGFWGLILGVPVCTYIFGHAIRYKELPQSEIVEII